jgi:hypothetical protein
MYYNLRGKHVDEHMQYTFVAKHVDEHMQYTFVAKLASLLIHQGDL